MWSRKRTQRTCNSGRLWGVEELLEERGDALLTITDCSWGMMHMGGGCAACGGARGVGEVEWPHGPFSVLRHQSARFGCEASGLASHPVAHACSIFQWHFATPGGSFLGRDALWIRSFYQVHFLLVWFLHLALAGWLCSSGCWFQRVVPMRPRRRVSSGWPQGSRRCQGRLWPRQSRVCR